MDFKAVFIFTIMLKRWRLHRASQKGKIVNMRYEYAKIFVSPHTDSEYLFLFVFKNNIWVVSSHLFYIVAMKKKIRCEIYAFMRMHVSLKRFALFVFSFVFVALYSSHKNKFSAQNKHTMCMCVSLCVWQEMLSCLAKAKRCGSFWFFCMHTNQHIALSFSLAVFVCAQKFIYEWSFF